jgi:hydrogenase maturation protease
MPRVLVAGIGNLFLSDDGFGPEVVRRLAADAVLPDAVLPDAVLPDAVRVTDYGIRGMHLAYDLLDPYDAVVLVDALPGGGAPGRIEVFEVAANDVGGGELDAHGMDPAAVLAAVRNLGGTLPPTYVVGCRVAHVGDGIGLSPVVAAAVPEAVTAVRELVGRLVAEPARGA